MPPPLDLDAIEGPGRLYATPDQVQSLIAELRAAREAQTALIEMHDHYDGPDYHVRGQLWRILAAWNQATGGGW